MPSNHGNLADVDGEPGVPRDEGESWDELADRRRSDVRIERRCPKGCFKIQYTVSCDYRDAKAFVDNIGIGGFETCPNCESQTEYEEVLST